jgi:hypothetical protein
MMLPRIATPRAPPMFRNVPLVADPTPVCSSGSVPISEPVDAGMTSPAPTPIKTAPATTPEYVVVTVAPEICHRPPAWLVKAPSRR